MMLCSFRRNYFIYFAILSERFVCLSAVILWFIVMVFFGTIFSCLLLPIWTRLLMVNDSKSYLHFVCIVVVLRDKIFFGRLHGTSFGSVSIKM